MNLSDDQMRSLDAYLTGIEREEGITIAAAWIMGSHARGVANEGSDIDIKYVFVQSLFDYPSLTRRKMSLRHDGEDLHHGIPYADQMDEDLEFMGWNAMRFLELLGDRDDGNNPSAIECLMSPLTIRTHPVITDLREYVNTRFNIIEMYRHYQGLSKRNWMKYIEDDTEPTAKRMLYILRGVLYARYIRDTHELPTLDIPEFLDTAPESVFEGFNKDEIEGLVWMKQEGKGGDRIETARFKDAIDAFIEDDLDYQNHIRDDTMDAEALDDFMFDLLRDAHP